MKKLIILTLSLFTTLFYSQSSSKINNAQNAPTSVANPPFLIGADPLPDGTWRKYIKSDIKWETTNINGLSSFVETLGNSLWQPLLGFTPVTNARTLNINGTTYDLSSNRTWTVGDISSSNFYANPSWLTELNYSKITDPPSIPTNTNQLINGSGFLTSVPAQTFASITFKPTTLSGYGILDAYPLTGNPSGFLTSFTEVDPMVPSYSKSLTGFNIIKSDADLLYYPLVSNPNNYVTSSSLTTTLGGYTTTGALTSGLATKENSITSGTTLQYWRGDKTWQTLNTSIVPENTNLYYTDTRARLSNSAGTGISYNSTTGVITNSSPDQIISITGVGGSTVTGTYPSFTIISKRQETYSGVSNASGNYTVTFTTSYTVAPNIQTCLVNPNVRDTPIVTVSSTGFTVNIQRRTDVLGLLPTYANVNGGAVDVLITEK